jgi:hypothetical protein
MRRILKFVTIAFVMATFLMPLLECFDCWDKPGLSNDTELPVFLIVLSIALVLLALVTMTRNFFDRQNGITAIGIRYEVPWDISPPLKKLVIASFIIPPLRI